MEKKTSGILSVMQKLDKALGNKAKGTGGNKDFKDLRGSELDVHRRK